MTQPNFENGVPVAVNPDDQDHTADDQFAVEGNDLSGYVGVSPEYQTYADDTHKPLEASDEVPAEPEGYDEDDYSTWTQAQLEQELKDRELPYSGTKAEQIERLEKDDEANPA